MLGTRRNSRHGIFSVANRYPTRLDLSIVATQDYEVSRFGLVPCMSCCRISASFPARNVECFFFLSVREIHVPSMRLVQHFRDDHGETRGCDASRVTFSR